LRILPVIPTLKHMLSSTLNNLGFAFKAQWPWFVVMGVVFTAVAAVNGLNLMSGGLDLKAQIEANPEKALVFVMSFLVAIIVGFLGFASIAVSWHRYVLLDEVPQGLAKLRVDRTVWRYFGNMFLIALCIIPLMIPVSIGVTPLMAVNPFVAMAGFFVFVMLVMLPIIYRLSIKLPAVALGRTDFKLGNAWDVSRGNWWPIVGVSVIFSLISWGIDLFMTGLSSALYSFMDPAISFSIEFAANALVNWIVTVMGITMLTSLYGYFEEKRDF
jgi:hypothetical protein